MYAQDAWTIARRLTLQPRPPLLARERLCAGAMPRCRGLRGGRVLAERPDECLELGRAAPPRARSTCLATAETVVKGGWGRLRLMREQIPELTSTNRNNPTTTNWTWRDRNGNRAHDAGEVNLDPNGPDFQGSLGRPMRCPTRTRSSRRPTSSR